VGARDVEQVVDPHRFSQAHDDTHGQLGSRAGVSG
jgi:hypothetical protein